VQRILDPKAPAALAPVEDYLAELHERVSGLTGGNPADYIPELGKADPAAFGIALATVDGEVYAVGDADRAFTIQSVSKPFMYGYALQRYGREAVLMSASTPLEQRGNQRSRVGLRPRPAPFAASCVALSRARAARSARHRGRPA
jgi:glutaminase